MNHHRASTNAGRGQLPLWVCLSLLLGCAGAPPREEPVTVDEVPAAGREGHSSRPSPSDPWRIALLDPETSGDVPEPLVQALAMALRAELQKLHGVTHMDMHDARSIRDLEEQKRKYCKDCPDNGPGPDPLALQTCADDACLAATGGAQGFNEVLRSRVSQEGAACRITLRRFDVREAATVRSVTTKVPRQRAESLLDAIGPLVAKAYPEAEFPLGEGERRGIETVRIPQK